jgi:hypothetical protein
VTLATTTSLNDWQRSHPGKRRCDVYRVRGGWDCAGVSVAWFTARCPRGHSMSGSACSACANAAKLGCANCWFGGTGYQPVTITCEELAGVTV